MPAKAAPPPKQKAPPKHVHLAGKQEDFVVPATQLAAALGWEGDPSWLANEISVADAINYICKTMHEHFQSGAKGEAQPDYKLACEHLAVDNDSEQQAIDEALLAVYESGKGAETSLQPTSSGDMTANLTGGAATMLSKFGEAGSKVGS